MTATDLSRRALLKVGAAAPLAAMLPMPAMATAVAYPVLAETTVTVPVAAMSAWGWWAGTGGEGRYSLGPFPTREAAVQAGRRDWDGAAFDIIEATPGAPDLRVTGDDILELLDGHNEDHHDPDGDATIFPYSISREATKELGDVVSAAISAWVERHNVVVKGYMFDGSRNEELVPEDAARRACTDSPSP